MYIGPTRVLYSEVLRDANVCVKTTNCCKFCD